MIIYINHFNLETSPIILTSLFINFYSNSLTKFLFLINY